jgi:hypothetical protein
MVDSGMAFFTALMVLAKCNAPPSSRSSRVTEVITMCFRPISFAAAAIFSGSARSKGEGFPVKTAQ